MLVSAPPLRQRILFEGLYDVERATTVRLRVLKPDGQPFKYTLNRFPYNLDFREIKEDYKVVDKEIVLSVPRLQQTFGAILKGKPNYAKIA